MQMITNTLSTDFTFQNTANKFLFNAINIITGSHNYTFHYLTGAQVQKEHIWQDGYLMHRNIDETRGCQESIEKMIIQIMNQNGAI